MNITFLGTGTSHGVPSIDCMIDGFISCPQGVCRESVHDARHRRMRSSLLVQWEGKSVLIDAGPDFREQCLREKVTSIDALLVTHAHADHICGIPDIRSYTKNKTVSVWGSEESVRILRATFPYIFDPDTPVGGGIPRISVAAVNKPFDLFGIPAAPLAVEHLQLDGCFGWRIGDMSYIPDVKRIPAATMEMLTGTEVLILNCLRRERKHASHLILPQSIAIARRIAPRRCFFTHMCHDIHYARDASALDPWMEFAWDGLTFEV